MVICNILTPKDTVMKKSLLLLPVVFCFMISCQDKQVIADLEACKSQTEIEELASDCVTRLGSSENHTVMAIEFTMSYRNSSGNTGRQRNTDEYDWLTKNAEKFGFYNYEKEPWHWSYNPPAR